LDSELFPEMLNAIGLATFCCADNWDVFVGWARKNGYLEEGEELDREIMRRASRVLPPLIRQIEIEMIAARLDQPPGKA